MEFTLDGDVDELFYETDAQPILNRNEPQRPTFSYENQVELDDCRNPLKKDATSDDSDDENGHIDCDHLVKSAMPSDAGQFKAENSAIEVANSSGVRIGNSFNQKTVVSFEKATSVVVDRRTWNYINCPESSQIPFQKPDNQLIVNKVKEFNQDRYRNRLAYFTPLPWCTWFSPHLDNLYTTLKLVTSDRFDGRAGHCSISLEQIVQDKENEVLPTAGNRPCRVLIEGNPGFGKTTLTLKMASDWATKKEYLNKFHLVFLIPLRDFQGDLQSYLFSEFFPQHESSQDRENWWNYIKENHQSILFILDGLDELSSEHRAPIDMLLKGNIFDKVSVVVTSRSVSSDHQILSFFNRRIEIRGFGLDQTEQFIQNYFQIKEKPQRGSELISLLNGPYSSSRHLASCPLTCLFLCVVYEDEGDHGILHKMTQIYQGLVSWLIRRASNKKRITLTDRSSTQISPALLHTPQDYEKALSDFGQLCLQVLARGGNQFTYEQLKELPNDSCELVLELGLVVRSNLSRNITLCIPKDPSYQLIHKTFMEYLAALYLSNSIEERFVSHFHTLQSGSISRESLYLIFKFTAGLLAENAAIFFRLYQLSTFELPVITLFELLHESGATSENVRALSSMLDSEIVVVRSNQIELDGWAGLLAEPDCPIRSLKFVWADPPFNSAALDRFFTAFQTNRSVVCLVITIACGLSPDENDVVAMGAFTVQALKKTQLRHFSLHLIGDTWSEKVMSAVINMFNYRYAASSLTTIKISTDIGTEQVVALSKGLQRSNVKSLILSKLSCQPEGYKQIAQLLKSLQHLSLSLNLLKTLPPKRVDIHYEEGSPEDLQILPTYFNAAARERAGMNVKEPLSFSKSEISSTEHQKEANFLLSVFSLLETDNHGNYKLHDGLKQSGFLAPNVLGLLKQKEPVCQTDKHTSGFHSLFTALREPDCQLTSLDMTGCCLELLDLNCLGQALRCSPRLKSLRLAKLKSFKEVQPILINSHLTWLDVSSGYITVEKESIIKLLCALSTATKLVSLSLSGWKFIIGTSAILKVVDRFMTSSPLQELNLSRCRFQMDEQLPHPTPVGSSCLSIISQIATNQNGDQSTRWNSSKFLDTVRPHPPQSGHQSPNISTSDKNILDDLEPTLQSETSSNSEEVSYYVNNSKGRGQWPNLVKLSLTEAVASFQGADKNDVEVVSGPQLFILLDRLTNLTELSVSMKPKMPESATPVTSIPPLNDVTSKQFFRAIQQRLGSKLERLCMSFCSIMWQRPTQTAWAIARCLSKCEKLVELEFNFVHFCAAACQGEPIHWFVNSVIAGCPQLKELSLIGMTLTLTQAYNLGLQIRDRWKGDVLRIHIWRTSNDENQPIQIILNLLHTLKNDSRFETDYIGGYKETVVIRRKNHLCGLVSRFRQIKIGIPKFMPFFCPTTRDLFHFRASVSGNQSQEDETISDNVEKLRSSLPPGRRSLFGLTPFDYSIMLANFWDSNET